MRDEDIIQDQIDEAEETIAREVAHFETHYPPEKAEPPTETQTQTNPPQTEKQETEEKPVEPVSEPKTEEPKEPRETREEASDTVGAATKREQSFEEAAQRTDDTPTNHGPHDGHAQEPDIQHDDGGEVVEEDQEDTVIY